MLLDHMIKKFKLAKYDRLVCRGPVFLKHIRDDLGWEIDKAMVRKFISSKKGEIIGEVAMLVIEEGGSDWPAELIQLQNIDNNMAVYIHYIGGRWVPIKKEIIRVIRETAP